MVLKVERVEVTENGPVKYVRRGFSRRLVRSERIECTACGKLFWRWVGEEGDECAACKWDGKTESSGWGGIPARFGKS